MTAAFSTLALEAPRGIFTPFTVNRGWAETHYVAPPKTLSSNLCPEFSICNQVICDNCIYWKYMFGLPEQNVANKKVLLEAAF